MNMNEMNTDSLLQVYAALKDRYSLMLTNTAALDDDFDMDCSIIVGKAHGRILYLYEYYGEFVLDVMTSQRQKEHTGIHGVLLRPLKMSHLSWRAKRIIG